MQSSTWYSGICPNATTLTNTTVSRYASDDTSCPATDPPITSYNNNPAYLILGFQNDYRTSDAATTLNYSDDLVESVGAGTWVDGSGNVLGSNNCGMPTPGGEGTFYAGAIISAQQYLTSNHSDRRAGRHDSPQRWQRICQQHADGRNSEPERDYFGYERKLYSATAECAQAVTAANYAKTTTQSDGLATEIYSISYGSETSGCTTGDTLTPCATMSGIASLPLTQYFFSVPQTVSGKTSTVCTGAVPITTLDQVFTTIAGDLMSSRLIPNTAF